MKRKKEKYSLTQKQRKEQRKGLTEAELAQQKEADEAKKQQRSKKVKFYLRVVAICLVAVLAFGAIASGIYLLTRDPDYDNDVENPHAIITLKDGRKIDIELLYMQSKQASNEGWGAIANLIYLAESKFYDNTMFSNINHGFLTMEGYTAPSIESHRGREENFVQTLKGFSDSRTSKWNHDTTYRLGYRITRKTAVKPASNANGGYVAMLSGTSTWSTSTGFMLIHENGANLIAGSNPLESSYMTYMGLMDAESIAIAKEIAAMESTDSTMVSGWKYPTNYQAAMIDTVRIVKLNKDLRKKITTDFENYVLNKDTEGGIKASALTTWRKGYLGT